MSSPRKAAQQRLTEAGDALAQANADLDKAGRAKRAARRQWEQARRDLAALDIAEVVKGDPEWEARGNLSMSKRVGEVVVTIQHPDVEGYMVSFRKTTDRGIRLPDLRRWSTLEGALARAAAIFNDERAHNPCALEEG